MQASFDKIKEKHKVEQLKTSNKRLFDNVGFLLNNLNIRHNNVKINNQRIAFVRLMTLLNKNGIENNISNMLMGI